jgi:hypothetical protein
LIKRPGQPASWRIAWLSLTVLLIIALLMLPLYQAATGNIRSASKQTVYTLLLLAPLAGLCCARIMKLVRSVQTPRARWVRLAGAAASMIAVVAFCNQSLDQVWSLQHRWPSAETTVTLVRQSNLPPGTHVLAEGSQIYQYYLQLGADEQLWMNTWSFDYAGQSGTGAMEVAIRDRYFGAVVLDDYYTPGVRAQLTPALEQAGYKLVSTTNQMLSTGETIKTTIYAAPAIAHHFNQQ